MKSLLYLFLIIALYFLYILLRFVLKRVILLHKFKCFVKENHLQYDLSVSAFLFPSNRCGTAVLLRTDKSAYNVHLFGLLRKNCAVHFWNEKEYSVEKFIPRMSLVGERPLGHSNAMRRKLGQWQKYSDMDVPVLLYSSANGPIHITQTQVNRIVPLRAGDRIGNIMLVDTDYLLRYIEKEITKERQ